MLLARLPCQPPGPILPFGQPAAECPILLQPLAEAQAAAAAAAGATLMDCANLVAAAAAGARAAIAADLFVTPAFVRALLQQSAGPGLRRAQIAAGTAHHEQVCRRHPDMADPAFIDAWAGDLAGQAPTAWPLTDDAEDAVRCDPFGPPPHLLRIPTPSAYAAPVRHWLDLLEVNMAALSARTARLGARNQLGDKVKIHATAMVEGSVLEDGVHVDAGASVIGCHVGRGARIASQSVFDRCVIGEDCSTLIDTHFRRSVFAPGSTLSNVGSTDMIMGRNAFITTGVSFYGRLPGQNATVEGKPSRRPVVGIAVGHRSILGARALFASGLSVPNDTIIVMRPDEGATKLDEAGLARAHMLTTSADEAV